MGSLKANTSVVRIDLPFLPRSLERYFNTLSLGSAGVKPAAGINCLPGVENDQKRLRLKSVPATLQKRICDELPVFDIPRTVSQKRTVIWGKKVKRAWFLPLKLSSSYLKIRFAGVAKFARETHFRCCFA